MSLNKVVSSLVDFSHDVKEIASILSDVFSTGPAGIASGLTSASITVEHASEAGFSELNGKLSKDFNLVGNSIAGFADNGRRSFRRGHWRILSLR